MRTAVLWLLLASVLAVPSFAAAGDASRPGARPVVPPPFLTDLVARGALVAQRRVPPQSPLVPVVGPVDPGKPVILACDVAVVGAPVRRVWEVAFAVDGQLLRSFSLPPAAAGFRRVLQLPYVPTVDGTRRFTCTVDPRRFIPERNERNNLATATLVVKPLDRQLATTLRFQETNMWCWAASGEMVMDYLGRDVSQCQEANVRFGRSDCCQPDAAACPKANCAWGGWPQFDKFNCTSRHTSSAALTFEQLLAEFQANRPVAFSWGWPGGSGHMMVAYGLRRAAGGEWVYTHDPWAPCQGHANVLVTYPYYVAQSGHHTHWDDYYEVVCPPPTGVVAASASERSVAAAAPEDEEPGRAESEVGAATDVTPKPTKARSQPTPRAAASATLKSLGGAVPGLSAPGDARGASLGEPVREAMIRLDELQAFQADQDAATLVHETGTLLVPVTVGGEVRSQVTVARSDNGYATVAVGNEWLAQAVGAQMRTAGATSQSTLVVSVPALNVVFLAQGTGKKMTLTPIADDPRLEIKAGEALPVATVMERLSKAAQDVKPNTPG